MRRRWLGPAVEEGRREMCLGERKCLGFGGDGSREMKEEEGLAFGGDGSREMKKEEGLAFGIGTCCGRIEEEEGDVW